MFERMEDKRKENKRFSVTGGLPEMGCNQAVRLGSLLMMDTR